MKSVNEVQKAIRESTGVSTSEFRDAARRNLANFGSQVIQQQAVRAQQVSVNPAPHIDSVQMTLPAGKFIDTAGASRRSSSTDENITLGPIVLTLSKNGLANNYTIDATDLGPP